MSSAIGYRTAFLSLDVPIPDPSDRHDIVELTYPHFTVIFGRSRRLAVATAVNIDGAALVEIERGNDWHFDPRLGEADQAGPDVYAHNDLDRGHLVRRRDPVWGTPDIAESANEATFVFTNAAPQVSTFNQGENLWVGLEDHVLNYAKAYAQKISVFTGPVLAADDPSYRGLQVPRQFWKVAVWTSGSESGDARTLNAAGFVLDQTDALDSILSAGLAPGSPPPIAPFLTYQVPIADVRDLTGLDFGSLVAADIFRSHSSAWGVAGVRARWSLLGSLADIRLNPRST